MRLRALASIAAVVAAAAAQAWNATGHMVIAAIAQANLTPAASTEADRLLKIEATRAGSDDFVAVGPWADKVRNERRETGPWHYKDLYFRADGKPALNKPDEINVVTKIEELTRILADRSKPDGQRAEALRFLIHFVGDVHQPLHATSRESDTRPKGDRGGNEFPILAPDGSERGPKNLHALWDGGAGLLANYPREEGRNVALAEARVLMATIPKSELRNEKVSDPEQWAEESFRDAKAYVYDTPEGVAPSPAYIARSRSLAAHRLALAGYRLADLVNKALG